MFLVSRTNLRVSSVAVCHPFIIVIFGRDFSSFAAANFTGRFSHAGSLREIPARFGSALMFFVSLTYFRMRSVAVRFPRKVVTIGIDVSVLAAAKVAFSAAYAGRDSAVARKTRDDMTFVVSTNALMRSVLVGSPDEVVRAHLAQLDVRGKRGTIRLAHFCISYVDDDVLAVGNSESRHDALARYPHIHNRRIRNEQRIKIRAARSVLRNAARVLLEFREVGSLSGSAENIVYIRVGGKVHFRQNHVARKERKTFSVVSGRAV